MLFKYVFCPSISAHSHLGLLFLIVFFILSTVLHPAANQLVQSMTDGVRVTFSRPSRPPNIPSPPPLIPTTKPTDKPSFIQGGSISQVRHQVDEVYCWTRKPHTTDILMRTNLKGSLEFCLPLAVQFFFFPKWVPILFCSCKQ